MLCSYCEKEITRFKGIFVYSKEDDHIMYYAFCTNECRTKTYQEDSIGEALPDYDERYIGIEK